MMFPSEISGKHNQTQLKGVEPKMRERKLRSGVNWQGALKQRGVKQAEFSGELLI
jgi:hypothetical protein